MPFVVPSPAMRALTLCPAAAGRTPGRPRARRVFVVRAQVPADGASLETVAMWGRRFVGLVWPVALMFVATQQMPVSADVEVKKSPVQWKEELDPEVNK